MESRDEDTSSSRQTSTPASAAAQSTPGHGKQRGALPEADAGPASAAAAAAAAAPSSATATPPPSQSQLSKRRRGVGVVTPNACNECRKKRVKCDGRRPCGRCRMQRDGDCVYELPVRQSKEDLRGEIEHLRRRQRASDAVLSALARPELWEDVLHRLHGGETVDSISDWIESGAAPTSAPPGAAAAAAAGTLPLPPPPPLSFQQPYPPGPYAGASGPPYASFSPGLPASQQQHGSMGQQQNESPWGGGGSGGGGGGGDPYSATSQDPSTRSGSLQEWNLPPQSRVGSWVENTSPHDQAATTTGGCGGERYRGLDQVLASSRPDMNAPTTTWTDVSTDMNLVKHLLALYFCWEYPTFASLSKEHFLDDFQHGRPRYCSAILVNALLALGCRFSTQPNTRAVPDDPYSSGDHFFKECLRLFYLEDNHHNLTTIQALGIMSIREASCGRDSESWYYAGQSIRLAIEMGLHQIRSDDGDEDEIAVKSATFWGASALDHAWSLATGSLPQSSCFPVLPPKPAIITDIEASLWIPYTDDGAPLQRSYEQPSNVRSVYKCFCELSELVHRSLYVLHSPGRPLTSRDLLHIYTQYLNWYDSIPEVLRLGHNFTPAVLFAHMYYHFAILLLFRPLIKLRIIGSSISPKDVCLQAADAIQGLLRSYSQLYTLRRTPSFVPYFVLTSSIMHLAIGASQLGHGPPATHSAAGSMMSGTGDDTPGLARRPRDGEDHRMSRESSLQSSHSGRRASGPMDGGPCGGDGGGGGGGSQSVITGIQGGHGRGGTGGRNAIRLDQSVVNSINRGIADLAEMVPCHHFAEQALNILLYLAKKWNIDIHIAAVTKSPGGTMAPAAPSHERRLRPMTTSLNFFAPSMEDGDFNCSWGAAAAAAAMAADAAAPPPPPPPPPQAPRGEDAAGGGYFVDERADSPSLAKAAGPDHNPLFWPFPMQGRPMLPSGDKLEEAGFALL